MLTGIGIIIFLKQIPHFFGYEAVAQGDFSFAQDGGENTFSGIFSTLNQISPGATLIAVIALLILLLWENFLVKKAKLFQLIQGPLVAVVVGVIFSVATNGNAFWAINSNLLVSVPVAEDLGSFISQFTFPNFAAISNSQIWITAFTIALVASLETLLCVEATDSIDPLKRVTPTNRELMAQGTGNIISGLIGGLPITQVIVRSSANIHSGGKTKLSAIIHGFFLLISVLTIPFLLNKIPLSVLAAILFLVGYKLAKPALFITMYKLGWKQFVPFVVTILGIVFTDLLIGIGLGLVVGITIILIKSYQNSHFLHIKDTSDGKNKITMQLAEEVTFINKGAILKELELLPEDSLLELDVSKTVYLDNDVIEILDNFLEKAKTRNIEIILIREKGTTKQPESFATLF